MSSGGRVKPYEAGKSPLERLPDKILHRILQLPYVEDRDVINETIRDRHSLSYTSWTMLAKMAKMADCGLPAFELPLARKTRNAALLEKLFAMKMMGPGASLRHHPEVLSRVLVHVIRKGIGRPLPTAQQSLDLVHGHPEAQGIVGPARRRTGFSAVTRHAVGTALRGAGLPAVARTALLAADLPAFAQAAADTASFAAGRNATRRIRANPDDTDGQSLARTQRAMIERMFDWIEENEPSVGPLPSPVAELLVLHADDETRALTVARAMPLVLHMAPGKRGGTLEAMFKRDAGAFEKDDLLRLYDALRTDLENEATGASKENEETGASKDRAYARALGASAIHLAELPADELRPILDRLLGTEQPPAEGLLRKLDNAHLPDVLIPLQALAVSRLPDEDAQRVREHIENAFGPHVPEGPFAALLFGWTDDAELARAGLVAIANARPPDQDQSARDVRHFIAIARGLQIDDTPRPLELDSDEFRLLVHLVEVLCNRNDSDPDSIQQFWRKHLFEAFCRAHLDAKGDALLACLTTNRTVGHSDKGELLETMADCGLFILRYDDLLEVVSEMADDIATLDSFKARRVTAKLEQTLKLPFEVSGGNHIKAVKTALAGILDELIKLHPYMIDEHGRRKKVELTEPWKSIHKEATRSRR